VSVRPPVHGPSYGHRPGAGIRVSPGRVTACYRSCRFASGQAARAPVGCDACPEVPEFRDAEPGFGVNVNKESTMNKPLKRIRIAAAAVVLSAGAFAAGAAQASDSDRKSTRLNSSHVKISYA